MSKEMKIKTIFIKFYDDAIKLAEILSINKYYVRVEEDYECWRIYYVDSKDVEKK